MGPWDHYSKLMIEALPHYNNQLYNYRTCIMLNEKQLLVFPIKFICALYNLYSLLSTLLGTFSMIY